MATRQARNDQFFFISMTFRDGVNGNGRHERDVVVHVGYSFRGQVQVMSKIGSIIIGARAFGLTAATDTFRNGIGAEQIGSMKIGASTAIPLNVGARNDLFAGGGAYPLGGTPSAGVGDGFSLHVFDV